MRANLAASVPMRRVVVLPLRQYARNSSRQDRGSRRLSRARFSGVAAPPLQGANKLLRHRIYGHPTSITRRCSAPTHHQENERPDTPIQLQETFAFLFRGNQPIHNLSIKMTTFLAIEGWYLAARFPDDVSVRYNAGLWMLDAHRYDDAVTYLRLATESQRLPRTVRGIAFESLGLALMNSGHIAEAEAPLRAALEQTPLDLRAYCSLTEVYKQSGRFEEAARSE